MSTAIITTSTAAAPTAAAPTAAVATVPPTVAAPTAELKTSMHAKPAAPPYKFLVRDKEGQLQEYPLQRFQQDSINYIANGNSVLTEAPTGSGKTAIAYAAMMKALQESKTFVYTAPIKAISEQKLEEFRTEIAKQMEFDPTFWGLTGSKEEIQKEARRLAHDKVGLITGDRSLNPNAPVKIMTTEVYNLMSQSEFYGEESKLGKERIVVFDELHYLGDFDRGRVWEESLIYTPSEAQVIGLSATIPDDNADELIKWINSQILKNSPVKMEGVSVDEKERPIQLEYFPVHQSTETPLNEIASNLIKQLHDNNPEKTKLPVIFFKANRTKCDELARTVANKNCLPALTEIDSIQIETAIQAALKKDPLLKLEDDYLKPLRKGVASHHAEHLPSYKLLVEQLMEQKLLKVVFATTTLAAGVNMPARSVVITDLDGLSVSEFKQMAGRAGRARLDNQGNVFYFCKPGEESDIQAKYIDSPSEPIKSALTPNYQTLLMMLDKLDDKHKNAQGIERVLRSYTNRSFLKHQTKTTEKDIPTQNLIKAYKAMINLLQYGSNPYLDAKYELTHKGRIAKEFKFNNPILITEFLFNLSAELQTYNKGKKLQDQISIRAEDLAAVLSLFADDSSRTLDEDGFTQFTQEIKGEKSLLDMPFLLKVLEDTSMTLSRQQEQLGITNNDTQLANTNFFAVHNWTTAEKKNEAPVKDKGTEERKKKDVQEFESVLGKDKPGKVLKGLRRTSKLLSYLDNACGLANFPSSLKKPLSRIKQVFNRGVLSA